VILLVLAEVSMKKTVFLDVASSNLVEIDRSLRGAYYESSVYFKETTRCHIPDGCNLQK
jgi:hypothetical protein